MNVMLQKQLIPVIKMLLLFACFISTCAGHYTVSYCGVEEDDHDYDLTVIVDQESGDMPSLEIESMDPGDIIAGNTPVFTCKIRKAQGQVWWRKGEKNLTSVEGSDSSGSLSILWAEKKDTGNYTCMAETTEGILLNETIHIRVIEPFTITAEQYEARVKVNESITLSCYVQGELLSNFTWEHNWPADDVRNLKNVTSVTYLDETHVIMTLRLQNVTSGGHSFTCKTLHSKKWISADISLTVIDFPLLYIDRTAAIGASSIFVKWSLDDGQDPVVKTWIQYMKRGTQQWQNIVRNMYADSAILLTGLENGTAYRLRIVASNSVGCSPVANTKWIMTFEKDPNLVPNVSIMATTLDSMTIGSLEVPTELQQYVKRYYAIIEYTHGNVTKKQRRRYAKDLVIEKLESNTSYKIKAAGCNKYTNQCSHWSPEQEVVTKDRDPKFIPTVSIRATTSDSITIEWLAPPPEIRDRVHQYKAMATHQWETTELIFLNNTVKSYVFANLSSQTGYWLYVAACSDLKTQCGDWSTEQQSFTKAKVVKKARQDAKWLSGIAAYVLIVIIMVTWLVIKQGNHA